MADRNQAFAEWRKNIISDDSLKQVVNDLETVVDVLHAMGEHGVLAIGFRRELESAHRMYESRRAGRS
jgi:hypothetical protein